MATPHRRVDDRGLEHLKALYRGEIAWTDQAVGQLLDMLEEHGRLDDTLIVITADHGEEFFEHDRLTHRFHLFDEAIRVPLLIVLPRSWERAVSPNVEAQVTLSDILPTLLDLLDIEAPTGLTGRSLVPAIEGEAFASRPELISLYLVKYGQGGKRKHMQIYGLRTPEWKFTRSGIMKPGEDMRVQGELYDPGERNALSDQQHPAMREVWAGARGLGIEETAFAGIPVRGLAICDLTDGRGSSRSTAFPDLLQGKFVPFRAVDHRAEIWPQVLSTLGQTWAGTGWAPRIRRPGSSPVGSPSCMVTTPLTIVAR